MRIEIRGAERLSFRERQVVVLKETGYSTEAIARRLGLAPGTVATLYNRARSKGYEVVIVIDGDPLRLFGDGGDGDEEGEGSTGGPVGGDPDAAAGV
ncbi:MULTISPECIES: sigma factor-like helix-turn-helix DNA-binding protein [Thermaerobacter]|uniref:Sigma-70 region 4 domain-containing protein n=1 Tax=Thermaerobacter composti TaxID=554949 RepID=A0ABZ0QQY1_9FIRM|nr:MULTISPECIES: sigma-70 region 4 domain-containing protein [Thermaerobacter]PZN08494.1 MAG: RNA polymerase subunit sigma-70 [Bacillota bacterium]QBS37153.1 sigma-70 family RNA polymerase sigma factor [Thermaerobacter sp. FW80]WPD19157.1 sigma-70 region 4 domain-containing protein [Thermaerobacter composti]